MSPMHPGMGPHYRVPDEPEQTPPRFGRGKKATWLVLAVVALLIAVAAGVAVLV